MQEISKMKRFLNRYSVWATVAAAGLLSVAFLAQGQAPAGGQKSAADGGAAERRAFLNQYCVGCHNQRAKELGVEAARHITLDTLNTEDVAADAEKWELVVRKVRAGMMPPSGMPRPEPAKFEAWIESAENALDKDVTEELPPPGIHRLNRNEYANVIRDLLGLDIDPGAYLPSDDSTRGFDNVAAALTISPALLEGYVSAAGKLSRLAVGNITTAVQTTYRVPEDTSQNYHVEGMPFGTRGGLLVEHFFPADAEYAMKITPISKGNMGNNRPFGEIPNERLQLIIDGELIREFDWDSDATGEDHTFNARFPMTAGKHMVAVTFTRRNVAPGSDLNEHFLRSTLETGGLPGFRFYPHVGKFVIDGPYNAEGATDTEPRRRLFVCTPANEAEEVPCARKIVNHMARLAFRRPVTEKDTEMLMGFYQQGRNEGTFDDGIEMALRRTLADPEFVFRKEAEPANLKPGERYRISDVELASRLSFFIWSSIPDEELLDVAEQDRLHDPAVLEQQVKRMLADPKSVALVDNFAGQWLGMRALKAQIPVANLFPNWDDNLRNAMYTEMEMFVASIIQNDMPVTDLLDADYTFVNERLANHYGIPNVYGSAFRKIELGDKFDVRRGLLGKGSLETISSQPGRTSPVQRGKTVMQTFLGVEPPAPPPNVEINLQSDDGRGGTPTMRQQMEMHRSVEPCASCHKIMDPIGFSLENFDAIGAWRTMDAGQPVDPNGQLVDGTKLDGVKGLRAALVRYSPQFVRVATEKLLIYALGRGTEYYDMPLVRKIVHEAEKDDYRFSALVLGVVKSDVFQKNEVLESSVDREGVEVAAR